MEMHVCASELELLHFLRNSSESEEELNKVILITLDENNSIVKIHDDPDKNEIKEFTKHSQTSSRENHFPQALQELWKTIQPKITPETTVTVTGDLNTYWNSRNIQRRQQDIQEDPKKQRHEIIRDWTVEHSLTNVLDDYMENSYITYKHPGTGYGDDKDMMLVSSHTAHQGISAVGVIQASETGPTKSLHWPTCLEFNTKELLDIDPNETPSARYFLASSNLKSDSPST